MSPLCETLVLSGQVCHPERRAKPEVEGSSHRMASAQTVSAKILRLAALAQDDRLGLRSSLCMHAKRTSPKREHVIARGAQPDVAMTAVGEGWSCCFFCDQPSTAFFRRIRTALPLRPRFLHNGSASCGTAIAVPYSKITKKQPCPVARAGLSLLGQFCLRSGPCRTTRVLLVFRQAPCRTVCLPALPGYLL